MSDARALRERLEQVSAELRQAKAELDKQRAQHAREQKALQADLEATRTEASKLLARIEKAEERERERAVVLPAEPVQAEGASLDTLVALARVPEPVEQALPVLSRLLRLSPVDLRLRLSASQPSILARLPDLEAEALHELLVAEGFAVVSAPVSRLVGGLTPIRRFTLEPQHLVLEDMKRVSYEVPYSELRLLMRGRRKSTSVETKSEMDYSLRTWTFSDRLELRRPTEEKVKHLHIENFLWLYGGEVRAAFSDATSFVSLGALQGLSKHASLQNLMEQLRQRAPHVVVDERLMGPSLSLPLVGPQRSQEALAGLIDQAIRDSVWH